MTYSDFTRKVERELRRIRRKRQMMFSAYLICLFLLYAGLYLLGVYVIRPWLF